MKLLQQKVKIDVDECMWINEVSPNRFAIYGSDMIVFALESQKNLLLNHTKFIWIGYCQRYQKTHTKRPKFFHQ